MTDIRYARQMPQKVIRQIEDNKLDGPKWQQNSKIIDFYKQTFANNQRFLIDNDCKSLTHTGFKSAKPKFLNDITCCLGGGRVKNEIRKS